MRTMGVEGKVRQSASWRCKAGEGDATFGSLFYINL